jgi:hypothetical protein
MLQRTSTTSTSGLAVQPDQKAVIAERVRGEFREMPGLKLTLAQASRLWSLEPAACKEVLAQLVETGFLCRRADGAFGRISDPAARSRRMAKAGIEAVEADEPKRIAQA